MKSVRRHVVEPCGGDVRQLDLGAQAASVRCRGTTKRACGREDAPGERWPLRAPGPTQETARYGARRAFVGAHVAAARRDAAPACPGTESARIRRPATLRRPCVHRPQAPGRPRLAIGRMCAAGYSRSPTEMPFSRVASTRRSRHTSSTATAVATRLACRTRAVRSAARSDPAHSAGTSLAVRRRPAQQRTQPARRIQSSCRSSPTYRRQSMCAPPPGAVPDPLEALSKAAARGRMERSGVATRDSAPLMRGRTARGLPSAHGGREWTQRASNIPISPSRAR